MTFAESLSHVITIRVSVRYSHAWAVVFFFSPFAEQRVGKNFKRESCLLFYTSRAMQSVWGWEPWVGYANSLQCSLKFSFSPISPLLGWGEASKFCRQSLFCLTLPPPPTVDTLKKMSSSTLSGRCKREH